MRPVVLVLKGCIAASLLVPACGGESESQSNSGGDSNATGGSGESGGSATTGGSPSGGSSGSGSVDFAACETSNDCVVTMPGCCGGCEPLDFRDVVAVNGEYREAFHASTCDPGVFCGGCADYPGPPLRPWYGAACRNGRCAPYDARAAASCTTDDDCHLRDGVGCCEGCGDVPAARLVAISSPEVLHSLACDVDTTCVTCDGTYPPGAAPACVDGLCAADLNLR